MAGTPFTVSVPKLLIREAGFSTGTGLGVAFGSGVAVA